MIIQFHTPKGIVEVDTETVTNKKLATLNMTRDDLNALMPRDPWSELADLADRVEALEKK